MSDDGKKKPTTFTRGSNIPEPSKVPQMPKNVKPPKEQPSSKSK